MSNCCDYDVVEWRPLTVLSGSDLGARCGHGAFAERNGDIVLVGGKECSSFNISRVQIIANSSSEVTANITEDITNEEMAKQNPRFAFASTYCSEEKIFFMHGGFDSQYNHSGTRFFLTDPPSQSGLRTLCTDNRGPSPRGYHSAVYVNKQQPKSDVNKVYTFGGQCCQGGPYTFFNDVHCLDLLAMDWSHVPCSGDAPSPRSQSFCFAYNGALHVYGGYDGRSIFTDLHRLDLTTREWIRVRTKGTGPVGLKGLFPLDFTIYFCQPCGVLLGHRLVVLTEHYDKASAVFYTLNLKTREWGRLRGRSGALPLGRHNNNHRTEFDPQARGNASLTLGSGGRLFLVGGHVRDPDSKDLATRIWTAQVPRPMSWERERLLWLACYKNDRGICNLAKCPPHVIYKIIGLINSNTFHIK